MAKQSKSKNNLVKAVLSILAIIASAFYIFFSIYTLDISDRIPALIEKAQPNLYGTLSVERVRVTLLPRPRIRADNFRLTTKDNELIEAKTLKVKLLLLPLLFDKYRIKLLSVEDGKIFVKRKADKTLNLNWVIKERLLDIKVKGGAIKNCQLTVIDATGPELLSFHLSPINANLYPTKMGFTYSIKGKTREGTDIALSGDAKLEDDKWGAGGSFAAKNLDLGRFKSYLGKRGADFKIAGKADIDISYSLFEKWTVRGDINYRDLKIDASETFGNTFTSRSGKSVVDVNWYKDNFHLAFEEMKLGMGEYDIMGTVKIKGPQTDPYIDLDLTTTPIEYASLLEIAPLELFSPKINSRIEAFRVTEGAVEIADFTLQGRLSSLKEHGLLRGPESFMLEMKFIDFKYNYKGFIETFSGISGLARFEGPNLYFKGLNGRYGTAILEDISGQITGLAGDGADHEITLKGRFDADDTLPEFKIFSHNLIPVNAKGEISLEMSFEKKDGIKKEYGSFGFENTKLLTHRNIPIALTNVNGRVAFESGKLTFHDFGGKNNGSLIKINGNLFTENKKKLRYDLSGEGTLTEKTLRKLLKGKDITIPSFGKPLAFRGNVKGSKGALTVNSNLDFTRTDLKYGEIIEKKKGFPMKLASSLNLNAAKTTIKSATLTLGGAKVRLSGRYTLKPLSYNITIAESTLKFSELASTLKEISDEENSSKGTLTIKLNAVRKSNAVATLITSEFFASGGGFKITRFPKTIDDISLTASFKGNTGKIDIKKFSTGKTKMAGLVNVTDLAKGAIEFELNADYLDFKDLRPKDIDKESEKRRLIRSGIGKILAKEGIVIGQPIKALTAEVRIDPEKYYIEPIILSISEGLLSGKAAVFRNSEEPFLYTTEFKLKNLDVETVVTGLGAKSKFLTGRLDADVKLKDRRGFKKASGLSGEISLAARDGKLWKFIVISKIFSIVNILSINELFDEGLTYKTLTADFAVEDGLFYSENILFESPSLRMTALGFIDANKKTQNITLGFHPFVTIDKIVTSIPLAGWIIGGKEKSTLSMYYELSGPIKDPDVKPAPVKAVSKKLLGIIGRVFTAPAKMIEPIQSVPMPIIDNDKPTEEKKEKNEEAPGIE